MANPDNSGKSFADVISMFVSNIDAMPGEKGIPNSSDNLTSKNIIPGSGSTFNRRRVNPILTSNEISRTYNTGLVFAKALYDFNIKRKADKKESSIVSQAKSKITPPPPPKAQTLQGGGILKTLLALFAGVAAFITGLMTDGPLKGTLKMVAKALIGIVTRQIKAVFNMSKAAIKSFIPDNFIGKAITNSIDSIKSFFKTKITAPFKALSQGTGFMSKIVRFLKPLANLLKKVPIIGNLISIGFAISRFKSGDNVGGVIDVLSALTGLLYLLPPVGPAVAFPLSLGLDVLNAILDVKTSGAKDKNKAKLDVLGDMAKSIGGWIWKNALWIPVIGGFKRMQMSWEAFKAGNFTDGLYQLGGALLSFTGLGPIVTGIEMLMGFGSNKQSDKSLSPKSGWLSGLKTWIKDKLKDLPYILRKPLEWFGILDETDTNKPIAVGSSLSNFGDKLKSFFESLWDNFKSGFADIRNKLNSGISTSTQEATRLIDSVNDYNPFSLAYSNVIGLNNLIEEDERLAKLGAERYRKTMDLNERIAEGSINAEEEAKLRKKWGDDRYERRVQELRKTLKLSTQPAAASLSNYKDKPNSKELEDQTNLIKLQNELLVQLVTTSKEQLNVSKKAKPSVAVVDSGSNTSNVSMNNAFSTSRPDGRSMYMSSPYSISPSFA